MSKDTWGFWEDEVVPPRYVIVLGENVHDQVIGLPVERSVNVTETPGKGVVVLAEKLATGTEVLGSS